MSTIVTRALAAAVAAATLIYLNPLAPAQAAPITSVGAGRPICAAPATMTMQFAAHDEPGNQAYDDLGAPSPDGPDIGDLIAFTQTLSRNGKTAGLVHVAAVVVDHQRHLSQANGSIELPEGVIEVAGIVTQTPTFALAVTGGTGSYTGATGQLTFHLTDTSQTLTLRLTLDASAK